jgi:hypothetical protein
MEGSPLNDAKGTPVSHSNETKQFTALVAKILGNPGALSVLTGQNMIMRYGRADIARRVIPHTLNPRFLR